MKKWIAQILILALALTALTGCVKEPASSETGSVYYLNFKPEQDAAWKNLAEQYTAETGIPVTVFTAASGTYEQQLMAEMGKSEAPTLFQVNGPVGLATGRITAMTCPNPRSMAS